MSKYLPGKYLVRLFDEYGTPCGWGEEAKCHSEGVERGRAAMASGLCTSFAVLQVTYNSITYRDRWESPAKPIF
jgi:hypothetical protein